MVRRLAVLTLAVLALAPAAQAAGDPGASLVAKRLATYHVNRNPAPDDARTIASCSGVKGGRQWRCRVTVASGSYLNGTIQTRYVVVGYVRGGKVREFYAYATGGIA